MDYWYISAENADKIFFRENLLVIGLVFFTNVKNAAVVVTVYSSHCQGQWCSAGAILHVLVPWCFAK
jgi:hypothetical protein